MKNVLYKYNLRTLTKALATLNHSEVHAKQLMNYIYRSSHKDLAHFSQFSPKVINFINSHDKSLPHIYKEERAQDGTIKFLIELEDKQSVETVLLPFYKKYTLCVSSQVGCAMGCEFCFTAKQGYKRNLKSYEIIAQILIAKNYLKKIKDDKRELTNIVFMGQGEPLHNFDALKEAIEIITDRTGLSISEKNITVSSVGYIPGLKRFNELKGVNFALSLHSAFEEKRNQIIPLNQKYPLTDILKEIELMKLNKKQTVEYEYILIKDFNDSLEDAIALENLLKERTHMINIIPFNPFPGTHFKKPSPDDTKRFKNYLVQRNLRVMIRDTKGDEILAACGQLNSKKDENEYLY